MAPRASSSFAATEFLRRYEASLTEKRDEARASSRWHARVAHVVRWISVVLLVLGTGATSSVFANAGMVGTGIALALQLLTLGVRTIEERLDPRAKAIRYKNKEALYDDALVRLLRHPSQVDDIIEDVRQSEAASAADSV